MGLESMLDISQNEIITVVGAGGKTSFIKSMANYYKQSYKVLMTTTTKIYAPNNIFYNEMILADENEIEDKEYEKGITVFAKSLNNEDKLTGVSTEELDEIIEKFDVTLIEGDGSKKKKLKGWNDSEPIVYNKTTKVIGILDISAYKLDINEDNIHRVDRFIDITNHCSGKVSLDDLKNICLHENGLFKNAVGKKILFINKVENVARENIAYKLSKAILSESSEIDIYYGSVKNNYYINVNSIKEKL